MISLFKHMLRGKPKRLSVYKGGWGFGIAQEGDEYQFELKFEGEDGVFTLRGTADDAVTLADILVTVGAAMRRPSADGLSRTCDKLVILRNLLDKATLDAQHEVEKYNRAWGHTEKGHQTVLEMRAIIEAPPHANVKANPSKGEAQ